MSGTYIVGMQLVDWTGYEAMTIGVAIDCVRTTTGTCVIF
jgi:hypothetical protein